MSIHSKIERLEKEVKKYLAVETILIGDLFHSGVSDEEKRITAKKSALVDDWVDAVIYCDESESGVIL